MVYNAYNEVFDIINHMDKELYEKIPPQLINLIKGNMEKDYEVNIDYTKSINEQNLLKETRAILSLIYRSYIIEDEEKQKIVETNSNVSTNFNEYMKEINKKAEFQRCEEFVSQKEETELVVHEEKKENIFKKILLYFKSFLKKK